MEGLFLALAARDCCVRTWQTMLGRVISGEQAGWEDLEGEQHLLQTTVVQIRFRKRPGFAEVVQAWRGHQNNKVAWRYKELEGCQVSCFARQVSQCLFLRLFLTYTNSNTNARSFASSFTSACARSQSLSVCTA
ncbi:hypothetical protein GOODEAATRI_020999 [Goodea atripinnis]|uniref:Uncharacterized protein n=1 Tax=Goodea atripinnis TaxID=208336 RepID=A0ABV0PQE8_9TELE